MAIISFDTDSIIDYVPEYGDNRDSEEPCVVQLKFISYAQVQRYTRMIQNKSIGKSDKRVTEVMSLVQEKQFIDSVQAISGYSVNGRTITDPKEFYDTADTQIIKELIKAMESAQKLDEGQAKNFEGACVTSTEQKIAPPLTAVNAPTTNE